MNSEYASALANHLWQSTLFAGAAALLTLGFRRNRASVRYWLWMAASVKFLMPFSLLIAIGSQLEWRPAVASVKPELVSTVQEIGQPFAPVASAAESLPPSPAEASTARDISSSVGLKEILFSMWLAGIAIVVFSWSREWWRLRSALKNAIPSSMKAPITTMFSKARVEPGVVGILRPVLLLPHGITERLTTEQMDAILVHELCHVRRRDNLAAAVHMLVETLFWFHPLVWWLERRLVEERERACDEEVLRVVAQPQTYAEGILNVCKFYKESPLVCMSGVTGSNLKNRIEEIMMNKTSRQLGLGRVVLLTCAALSALAVPIGFGVISGCAPKTAAATAPVKATPRTVSSQATGQPSSKSASKSAPQAASKSARPSSSQPPAASAAQSTSTAPKGSFIEELENAGYRNLDLDQMIAMKIHGVSGDYIRQLRDAGVDQLTGDDLVAFRIHGVNGDYVKGMKAAGFNLTKDQLVAFRIHHVTPEFVDQLKQAGLKDINPDKAIAMRIHGVDPAWVRQFQALGYPNINSDDIIGFRIHGVSPEFVKEAQSHGFKDLSPEKLMQLKRLHILDTR